MSAGDVIQRSESALFSLTAGHIRALQGRSLPAALRSRDARAQRRHGRRVRLAHDRQSVHQAGVLRLASAGRVVRHRGVPIGANPRFRCVES